MLRILSELTSPNDEGQGLAEYALILALIAIVAIVALLFLGTQRRRSARKKEPAQ